jgi:hypothetical protein
MTGHDGIECELVVPYQYGDHILLARHITCNTVARRYAQRYIQMLERDRAKESKQESLL